MTGTSQRAFLNEAKRRLSEAHPKLTWDRMAELAGIEPRAFKTYRMPAESADYREMPNPARAAIEKLLVANAQSSRDRSEPPPADIQESILPSALAALVLRQARQAIFNDRPISGVERQLGDHVGLEPEDRKAMALVSRARLRVGLTDVGAEIHELLFHCAQPLGTWLPLPQIHSQRLSNVILLDAEEGVPTREAEELARRFTSSTASLEELLFARFREQLAKSSRVAATGYYSRVREFVIRNPVMSGERITRLTVDLQLPVAIGVLINQQFYEPIPSGWGERGHINICAHCGNATKTIAGGDHCRTKACAESLTLTIKERLAVEGSYRLKRGIRQYWLEPGFDELRLYDELLEKGLSPSLYPELDRVDIAVDDVGIDLKAYVSPELLGARLATDMGGLKYYKRKWLVIPDRLIARVPAYLERVRGALGGSSIHAIALSSVAQELQRA